MNIISKEDFQSKLGIIFDTVTSLGLSFIYLKSGDLHRSVGGYPGPDHRMPICCNVMYQAMRNEDEIIEKPPKGKGANLVIKYMVPR
jgi:5-methylcytosine-specific restriction protein A